MKRTRGDDLLLGEWACLGVLALQPAHGFAIAARLAPSGDVGRVWSMSRALTYRALDQLTLRGLVRAVAEEPGIAGGNRTILDVTPPGRAALEHWMASPTDHLRDLRSELLLKLVLGEIAGTDATPLLLAQRTLVARLAAALDRQLEPSAGTIENRAGADVVALWRSESAHAALRFLDRMLAGQSGS